MLVFNIFIILLLVLAHLQNASTLVCIANSSLEILRSELLSTNDSVTLQKLHNKTAYPYKKSSVCHVTIHTDYNQINGNVTVEFGEDTNHTGNYFGIETWFPLTKENKSILSSIDYVCSLNNLCDQIFVEKWIYWLAEMNHETLQDKLISLLTSDIQSSRCDVAGRLAECSGGVCVAEYNANINKTAIGTGCIDDAFTIDKELYMKMQSIKLQSIQYEELTYFCSSDKCNDDSTFKHVWKETSSLFDFIKPIVHWLRLQNRCRASLNCTVAKLKPKKEVSSNVPVSRSNNYSSTTLFWSSFISIIIVLTGICVGCYYLYHRNSQGYTPTPTTELRP
jgi:hypothetical protein